MEASTTHLSGLATRRETLGEHLKGGRRGGELKIGLESRRISNAIGESGITLAPRPSFRLLQWRVQSGNGSPAFRPGF